MGEYWSAQVISAGTSLIKGPEVFWMSHWDEELPLGFNVTVLRRDEYVVLVNTSPPETTAAIEQEFPRMRYLHDAPVGDLSRESGEQLLTRLAELGIHPDDVTHILLTPLELYTTGLLHRFRRATIGISRRGWIHFHTTHDHPHDSRWRSIPRDTLVDLVTDSWDRVLLLDDEHEVLPGLRTWWCGVHHRESMVCEVDTAEGVVAISDAFFYYENIEQNLPIGLNESLAETLTAYARVRATADHVVPIHDPRVLERYPGGVIAGLLGERKPE